MAVRSLLKEELLALGGLEEHHFQSGSDAGVNLILKLPGRNPQLKPLLIGAHYDGPLQSIGADDNASGVSALLELARRWSKEPPNRPVWPLAFDQEEWGMLGSADLAADLKASRQKLKLKVSLEMLTFTAEQQDYPLEAMRRIFGERGDFIALIANTGSSLLLPSLAKAMGAHVKTKVLPVPNGGKALPDVRLSDHSPPQGLALEMDCKRCKRNSVPSSSASRMNPTKATIYTCLHANSARPEPPLFSCTFSCRQKKRVPGNTENPCCD